MYELEYVRKRRRKRIVAFVGGISAVVVTSFIIIAFLGRFVGTFTVNLETRNVNLTLLEKEDSEVSTSFLRVDVAAPFREFTYSYFDRFYGGDQKIDTEETTYTYGAAEMEGEEVKIFDFFKYTFFLENKGNQPAMYDWALNIVEDVASYDGRSLIDTLRVMVYEDGVKTVYGQGLEIPHYDNPEGIADYRAPVSVDRDKATEMFPFCDYATEFESSKVVTAFNSQIIDSRQIKRYTIVAWLEGFRSNPEEFAPRGAKIKLGVDINAYENK